MINRERLNPLSFTATGEIKISFVLIAILFLSYSNSLAQPDSDPFTYTVKEGDFLSTIAVKFGSIDFWQPIFSANRDEIDDPDIIFPGQKLLIPPAVANADKFAGIIPEKELKTANKQKELASDSSDVSLEKFRKAFSHLIEKNQKEETSVSSPQSVDPRLELGGLVINQTRSKIGKDFFNVFYQNWEPPSGISDFLLTITEQPAPGMGTIVAISLDSQLIFQSRLQPRRPVIEQQAQRAIIVSYRYLYQKNQLSNELNGY